MKAGLRPIKKTVVRSDTGKPHEQTYWMSDKEVWHALREAEEEGRDGLGGLMRNMRVDPNIASEFVGSWGAHGMKCDDSLAFLAALNRDDQKSREEIDGFLARVNDDFRLKENSVDDLLRSARSKDVQRTVGAIVWASQALYREEDEQVLFRGIGGRQAANILWQIRTQGYADVQLAPLSSFSLDMGTARAFGYGHSFYMDNGMPKRASVVIRQSPPVESIVMSGRLATESSHMRAEHEYVVRSHGTIRLTDADIVRREELDL